MNAVFDRIYLINLDRNKSRLEKTDRLLTERNIKYKRIAAIDGRNQKIANEYEVLLRKGSKINSSGALGCLMSHMKAIEDAKMNGHKMICILEDDILFHEDFDALFEKKIKQVARDWEMIYLGTSQKPGTWRSLSYNNGFYKAYKSRGTFAYCLKTSIFDELLELWKGKMKPVDIYLEEIHKRGKSHVFHENLIISDVTESDTQGSRSQTDFARKMKWNLDRYGS